MKVRPGEFLYLWDRKGNRMVGRKVRYIESYDKDHYVVYGPTHKRLVSRMQSISRATNNDPFVKKVDGIDYYRIQMINAYEELK